MVETAKDLRSFELNADYAGIYKSDNLLLLKSMFIKLWNDTRQEYQVRSKLGMMHVETKNFEIQEGGEVQTPEALVFRLKEATFNASKRELESKSRVSIKGAGQGNKAKLAIEGSQLLMNLNTGVYRLRSSVTAQQSLGKGNQMNIASREAIFQARDSKAMFENNVRVTTGNMNLEGDQLAVNFDTKDGNLHPKEMLISSPKRKKITAKSKTMNLYSEGFKILLDDEGRFQESEAVGGVQALMGDGVQLNADFLNSKIENNREIIYLKGNVNIKTQDKIAKCEEAHYYPDTGDMQLDRLASVVKDGQVLEGERIRFSTKSSEVNVERVKGSIEPGTMGR